VRDCASNHRFNGAPSLSKSENARAGSALLTGQAGIGIIVVPQDKQAKNDSSWTLAVTLESGQVFGFFASIQLFSTCANTIH
jgi:hypothetical protein